MNLPLHEGLFLIGEVWARCILPGQRWLLKLVAKIVTIVVIGVLLAWHVTAEMLDTQMDKYAWEHGAITRECVAKYGNTSTGNVWE